VRAWKWKNKSLSVTRRFPCVKFAVVSPIKPSMAAANSATVPLWLSTPATPACDTQVYTSKISRSELINKRRYHHHRPLPPPSTNHLNLHPPILLRGIPNPNPLLLPPPFPPLILPLPPLFPSKNHPPGPASPSLLLPLFPCPLRLLRCVRRYLHILPEHTHHALVFYCDRAIMYAGRRGVAAAVLAAGGAES
jgi:hypothetical protein